MARNLKIKDMTVGEIFHRHRRPACIRMTEDMLKMISDYSESLGASKSDVVAMSVAYYLGDLEQFNVEPPSERIKTVQMLKGKKRNVSINFTEAMFQLMREFSDATGLNRSDIVALSFVSYLYNEQKADWARREGAGSMESVYS